MNIIKLFCVAFKVQLDEIIFQIFFMIVSIELINIDLVSRKKKSDLELFTPYFYLKKPPIPPNPLTNWKPSEDLSVMNWREAPKLT